MKNLKFTLLIILLGTNIYAQKIQVSFDSSNTKKSFTGQVILYVSKTNNEPRESIEEPCFRVKVKDVKLGQKIIFDNKSIYYPLPLNKLERGKYYVQAVWDRDLGDRNIGTSSGNIYSKTIQLEFSSDTTQIWNIKCNQYIPKKIFINSTYVKELAVKSLLLSKFSGKSQNINGAVILPKKYYTNINRKYPVLFVIGGYGADYHHYSKENGDIDPSTPIDTIACIRVYLDGNCRLGHSVYANSDNNGPWADALVKEFIPKLKKTYRCNNAFLMKGHSSGGWAVLWLQIHYPNLFAGTNSSAPDYVDFHSINKRDYYSEVENVKNGKSAPSIVTHPHIEDVLYRGEQERSFDAVNGPRDAKKNLISIQDLQTGIIRPEIFEYWKRYDIASYLKINFKKLKPELYGKVRISVGNEDTYFLNFPVKKMEETLNIFDTGFKYAYYTGDHFNVTTPQYKKDEAEFLATKYLEWLKKHK